MKILVTGANGYIGSKVVKYLCNKGVDVIACDLASDNIDKRAKFVYFDILNFENINLYKKFDEPDVCLHLARRDGFKHFSETHMLDFSSHYNLLLNLVSNGLKKLCVMGTMHEIGYYEGAVDENTCCNPTNLYGISKNALRESTRILCQKFGCTWLWLRAFYIYGNDEYGQSVFSKLKLAANKGAKEFNLTSGNNCFDFIEINRLAELICLTLLQDEVFGIINVCSGKPVSLKSKILDYVKKNHININLNWGTFPERESESPCIYGNNTKIQSILDKFNN